MNIKHHYYLLSATLVYFREVDGVKTQKSKPMNAVLTNNKKLVTYELMDQGRKAVMSRAWEEMQISAENIVDYHINAFSHMGLMTADEFQGTKGH